jgi:hypothetical protein
MVREKMRAGHEMSCAMWNVAPFDFSYLWLYGIRQLGLNFSHDLV